MTYKPLRIGIFGSRGIPHTYSGYETFIGELAPRLVEHGHHVTVYCRSGLFVERPLEFKGVRLVYLPNIETKTMGTLTHTLISMFDALFRDFDVLFVVNVVNAFHCILPRVFGKPVAINVDGLDWKRGKWGRLGRLYFYWNAKCVGRVCPRGVVTDALEMQRIYQSDFATPSTVIAYGANIETSQSPEVVREYGLEPGQYYLVASRLVPENNAHLIVRGFERVKTSRLLAIAGGANYRSEFVEQLKKTNDSRVRFLGHVADSEHVKELHCNAHAYIHGHSLGGTNPALLKALGFGNCVLALDTPFNREVLRDYGILFADDASDLAMKLQSIDDCPQIAANYRARAPRRIQEAYTWDLITQQYERLFVALVAGDRRSETNSFSADSNNLAADEEQVDAVAR